MNRIKCPKCGSEVLQYVEAMSKQKYVSCQNIKCDFSQDTEKYIYQQRLEKVLAKFEKLDEFMSEKKLYNGYSLLKHVGEDTFMMFKGDNGTVLNGLSLDTVESLLKDLEVER